MPRLFARRGVSLFLTLEPVMKSDPRSRLPAAVAVLSALALFPGTASAATQRGSFDRPPYYDGKLKQAVRPAGHATISFRQVDGSLDPTPDKSPGLAAVLDSLRDEIARLGMTGALVIDPRLPGGPDVYFGARRGGVGPDGIPRGPEDLDTTEPRKMAFEVEGPSKMWKAAAQQVAGPDVRAIVTVQIGFGDHWIRQQDWKGNKAIGLGTGRSMPVAWLTSLDDPVQVLQLTGAVVTPDGKVLRVGAEGLIARRTGMAASVAGAQEVLREEELQALMTPGVGGEPVWRTALRALLQGLLEEPRAAK
jgi:hypothetical protein